MNTFTKYSHLYEPIKVGNITIPNRLEIPPMGPKLGTASYRVTEEMMAYFEERAKSGAGIVTVSDTAIDQATGLDQAQNFYIQGEDSVPELMKLTKLIHRHGAVASIELNHGGWEANAATEKVFTVSDTEKAESPLAEFSGKLELKIMDQDDIDYVIEKYAEAAHVAKLAGFDMIMIHGGHGSLPAQFISPLKNHRTDKYGGSPEKRMQFHKEMLKAVRKAVGEGFPIELRVSGMEYEPDGLKTPEVISYLKEIQQYIDIVHVSSGSGFALEPFSPYYLPRMVHVSAAAEIKAALDIPVAVVTAIVTLENAENIVASGNADFVAMGRPSLADPRIFKKGAEGMTDDDITPCVRCSRCHMNVATMQQVGCTVNPKVGNEWTYRCYSEKAPYRKKVVVVGGGPAGMQATRTLVQRGHEVVLFEKNSTLGGLLPAIAAHSFKEEYRRYYKWAVNTTMSCGATIYLNTEATDELIRKENPDTVIIAIGNKAIALPHIPVDGKRVVDVKDVDLGTVEIGEKVLIVGAGVSGVECGLELAGKGKDVTIVDMKPMEACAGSLNAPIMFIARMGLMQQSQIKFMPETAIMNVDEKGAFVQGTDGTKQLIETDTIVIALGNRTDQTAIDSISQVCPKTYVIGNAKNDGDMYQAIRSAYDIAMEIGQEA